MTLPRLLTIREVAAALRFSPPTVYTLVRSGQLPSITITAVPGTARESETGAPLPPRVGGVRVLEEDLAAFIKGHRSNGGAG